MHRGRRLARLFQDRARFSKAVDARSSQDGELRILHLWRHGPGVEGDRHIARPGSLWARHRDKGMHLKRRLEIRPILTSVYALNLRSCVCNRDVNLGSPLRLGGTLTVWCRRPGGSSLMYRGKSMQLWPCLTVTQSPPSHFMVSTFCCR